MNQVEHRKFVQALGYLELGMKSRRKELNSPVGGGGPRKFGPGTVIC